jgi:hypothetical protein
MTHTLLDSRRLASPADAQLSRVLVGDYWAAAISWKGKRIYQERVLILRQGGPDSCNYTASDYHKVLPTWFDQVKRNRIT